jgi:hypothetical protein
MPAFESRLQRTIDNPLVTGPLLQEELPVFEGSIPVPSLSAIPAGFDAIFHLLLLY